jgi:hypothetical protein
MDGKTKLQPGDKIVLKNNWSIIYILNSIDNDIATCYSSKGEQVTFPVILIEKYDVVRTFGL